MVRISSHLLDKLSSDASASDRLRAHFNFHKSNTEACQRLLISIRLGSYIQPHRHSDSGRSESLFAVRGKFALILFLDSGEPKEYIIFATEKYSNSGLFIPGVEIECDIWHTVIPLTPDSVLLEVKQGPFDPKKSKIGAPWAPDETDGEQAADYLKKLYAFCGESLEIPHNNFMERVSSRLR